MDTGIGPLDRKPLGQHRAISTQTREQTFLRVILPSITFPRKSSRPPKLS